MRSVSVTRAFCNVVLVLVTTGLASCHEGSVSAAPVSTNSTKLDMATARAILDKQRDTLFQPGDALTSGTFATVRKASKELLDRLPDTVFLQELADAGVLQPKTEKQVGTNTVYRFAPIPQAGVTVGYPGVEDWEYVQLTLAKPAVRSVTGVSQEGTTAEVEVEVGLVPTDLYKRVLPHVRGTVALCPSSPVSYNPATIDPASILVASFCGGTTWPDEAKFSKVRTATFHFKKFDDGWRIVRE